MTSPMRALVTGGTGKLGAGVVGGLRDAGWQVASFGSKDADIARPDGARSVVERAVAELGGLDVLVNAAAAGFVPRRFEDVTEEELDAALAVDIKGSFLVTQAAAPH